MSLKRVPNLAENRLDEWYTPKKRMGNIMYIVMNSNIEIKDNSGKVCIRNWLREMETLEQQLRIDCINTQ